MTQTGLDSYIIRGGEEGRARLSVLARALRPTTLRHIRGLGSIAGASVVDAACGGGDVTFDLADCAGPDGRVLGLDLDEAKLGLARAEAQARGLANVTFEMADVAAPWPVEGVDLVYARFILTHLADPGTLLRRARDALRPGGRILVEDIDIAGYFCDPESAAFDRSNELYVAAAHGRECDPFIGRRLARHLEAAGFRQVETGLVQPFGREGDAKQIAALTFAAVSGGIVAAGLATEAEAASIQAELDAFTARPDTTISLPRIFWARGEAP